MLNELNIQQGEIVKTPLPVEKYIPKDFPKVLFQGSSSKNSESTQKVGLRGGSLAPHIYDSFESRFFRGSIIVGEYSDKYFEAELYPYSQYAVLMGTGDGQTFTFDAIDTDGAPTTGTTSPDRMVTPEHLASFNPTPLQIAYIRLVDEFFGGRLCGEVTDMEAMKAFDAYYKEQGIDDVWSVKDLEAPGYGTLMNMGGGNADKGRAAFFKYALGHVKRREMARVLGIEISAFKDMTTLRDSIATLGDEDVLVNKLVGNFPGTIDFQWNNMGIKDNDLITSIIRQEYQSYIITVIKSLATERKSSKLNTILLVKGKSIEGLDQLIKDINSEK